MVGYEASVTDYQDVGGHVEYCVTVCHCSGLRWSVWRRFSDFLKLHEDLQRGKREHLQIRLEKSWLPAFSQSLSPDFCLQRQRELTAYLQKLMSEHLKSPELLTFLALDVPSAPCGLRVVRKHGLELEVTPEAQDSPVDGYWIEILHLETGQKHRLRRDVGASGRALQTARLGQLPSGRHCFAVAAFNVKGCSSPVCVTVELRNGTASRPRREATVADDDDQLCVVCLAAPKSHAFVPCGHRCVCASCAADLCPGSCPVCRTEAQHVIQIFT